MCASVRVSVFRSSHLSVKGRDATENLHILPPQPQFALKMNNPLTSGQVYQQMIQRYTHHIHTHGFKHALRA